MTQNKEDRDIARAFYNTYQGGHWILAAGTAYAGWYFTKTLGGQLFGEYTYHAACAAGLFAYYLLDNQVLKFAPRAITFVLSGFGVKGKAARVDQKSRANKIFDLMVVSVFALMLAASFYSNTIIVPDISGEITGGADTDTEKRSMGGNNATYERELTGYEEQVKSAQEALVSAKVARDADVNSAVNSELRRLASGGNDWAKGEIKKTQASVGRKHDRTIRKAQNALLSAQKDYKAFVSSQGGKVKDANMLLAGVVEKKEAKQENKFSRWHGWLSIAMYTGLALFLFGCIGWQCYQIDTGDNIVSDLTTGKVLSAFKSKAGQGANKGLARALGVRDRMQFQYNGNGTIAATLPRTAERRTNSLGATLSDREIADREHFKRDVERQEERRREPAGQNSDRDWTEIKTETEKRTEQRQNADRTEKRDIFGVVGEGSVYPDPEDKEAMKGFVKRLRAASSYNPNDPRVAREITWLQTKGWSCEERDGGKWIITRPVKTTGTVENEFEWDVMSNGETGEA